MINVLLLALLFLLVMVLFSQKCYSSSEVSEGFQTTETPSTDSSTSRGSQKTPEKPAPKPVAKKPSVFRKWDDFDQLRPMLDTSQCLRIDGTENGTGFSLQPCYSSDTTQKMFLRKGKVENGKTYYNVTTAIRNKEGQFECIDFGVGRNAEDNKADPSDNTGVLGWTCHTGDWSLWYFDDKKRLVSKYKGFNGVNNYCLRYNPDSQTVGMYVCAVDSDSDNMKREQWYVPEGLKLD